MNNENINVGGDKGEVYKTEAGKAAQNFIKEQGLVLDTDPEFINLKSVPENNETREQALELAYKYLQEAMKQLNIGKKIDEENKEKPN